MAYIVMAYIVMAYIAMVYLVMAYTVMTYSPWSENNPYCEYGCAVPRTHFPGRDGHETWPRPQGCLKGQFRALG